MDNRYTQACLKAAEIVLDEHSYSDEYSFDGVADCAVCLVESPDGWDVYLKERNATINRETHINVIDAIIDLINRVAGRNAAAIRDEFYNLLLSKDIA